MAISDLSIVVVSHNAKDVLVECLKRLSTHYPEAEVIVVDSGSSDGSTEWVQANYPNIKLMQLPTR
jgi:GT2 family glycosyltransferase